MKAERAEFFQQLFPCESKSTFDCGQIGIQYFSNFNQRQSDIMMQNKRLTLIFRDFFEHLIDHLAEFICRESLFGSLEFPSQVG